MEMKPWVRSAVMLVGGGIVVSYTRTPRALRVIEGVESIAPSACGMTPS